MNRQRLVAGVQQEGRLARCISFHEIAPNFVLGNFSTKLADGRLDALVIFFIDDLTFFPLVSRPGDMRLCMTAGVLDVGILHDASTKERESEIGKENENEKKKGKEKRTQRCLLAQEALDLHMCHRTRFCIF
jgi:hypothetical protein